MSLDALSELHVSKAKLFRSPEQPFKTVMCFLGKEADNISLVIDQQELCDNVISANVLEDLGIKKKAGAVNSDITIVDFTLMDFHFLVVLLNTGDLVVFDCHKVLNGGSVRQVRYLNKN